MPWLTPWQCDWGANIHVAWAQLTKLAQLTRLAWRECKATTRSPPYAPPHSCARGVVSTRGVGCATLPLYPVSRLREKSGCCNVRPPLSHAQALGLGLNPQRFKAQAPAGEPDSTWSCCADWTAACLILCQEGHRLRHELVQSAWCPTDPIVAVPRCPGLSRRQAERIGSNARYDLCAMFCTVPESATRSNYPSFNALLTSSSFHARRL